MPETPARGRAIIFAHGRLNAGPHLLGRRNGFDLRRQDTEPLLPKFDLRGERGLALEPELDIATLLSAQQAKHVFRGERSIVLVTHVALVGHLSRQALSLSRLRRIRAFHGPERNGHPFGQHLIGCAVQKRGADRGGMMRVQFVEAVRQALALFGRLDLLQRAGRAIAHTQGVINGLHPPRGRAGAEAVDTEANAKKLRRRVAIEHLQRGTITACDPRQGSGKLLAGGFWFHRCGRSGR